LFILNAAVGTEQCDACICDAIGANGVNSTDALLCLRVAVGESLPLDCPACNGGSTTSTTAGPTSTTTTSTTVLEPTTTTTTSPESTTTTTTGGDPLESGRVLYDARCASCHAVGSHDPIGESAGDIINQGGNLTLDLGELSPAMTGITLTEQELADLAYFLDFL
jgi:cytochrome c2